MSHTGEKTLTRVDTLNTGADAFHSGADSLDFRSTIDTFDAFIGESSSISSSADGNQNDVPQFHDFVVSTKSDCNKYV